MHGESIYVFPSCTPTTIAMHSRDYDMCCNLYKTHSAVILSHDIHVDAAQFQKRAERQRGLEALPIYESACVSFLVIGVLSLLQTSNNLVIPFNIMWYTGLI